MKKNALTRIAQVVHLLALSVWLGSVAMSGVVAAIVFPLMRELDPTLGAYPDYQGDHALLAAGRVASNVFFVVDLVQFVCASLALATIVVLVVCGYSLNTVARVLRVIVLCMTLALLSYHLLLFMPGLMSMLQGYWDNAGAGNTEVADRFKEEFLAQHDKASNILGLLALMVTANIVVAGVTLTARPRSAAGEASA
jgi:hypothetical protein